MRYALYKNSQFIRHQDFDTPPPTLAPEKVMEWRQDPIVPAAPDHAAEKAAVLAEARAVRERIFAILAGMQAESLALGDTTTARAIADAQAALRGITTLPAVVAAVTATETRAAIMAAYADIAVAVPANVRSAFRVLEQ